MKYELLIIFPLTVTEDEFKVQTGKIEERLQAAGATIHASVPLTKGKLAYKIGKTQQGYYHTIQFEMNPAAIAEFQQALILSGETLRFSITKLKGDFKTFTPFVPREMPSRVWAVKQEVAAPPSSPSQPSPISSEVLVQEKVVQESAPKVSMEELDKKLEEILGE